VLTDLALNSALVFAVARTLACANEDLPSSHKNVWQVPDVPSQLLVNLKCTWSDVATDIDLWLLLLKEFFLTLIRVPGETAAPYWPVRF
jgi:hypothetical protein